MARKILPARDDGFESTVWDKDLKRKMIITFVFFAAGLLFAWEYGKIYGTVPQDATKIPSAEMVQREETFWNQIQFLNPGYPPELREDVVTMGKRACTKLQLGWDPTRVLAFISQNGVGADPDVLPLPAGQTQFWIGLENAAALSLCPEQAEKLDKWMDNVRPIVPTSPTTPVNTPEATKSV